MKTNIMLKTIEDTVYRGDVPGLMTLLKNPGIASAHAHAILDSLSQGMELARIELKNSRISIPEFLFSVDAFREGINHLNRINPEPAKRKTRILIGVAEGEVHDLGKNIVAAVLDASGYEVIDLKGATSKDEILDAIKMHNATILALSAMMSTCISAMKETVAWVKKYYPGIRVLVGGAALDEDLASFIGAHGYAENAACAPDEVIRLIKDS
jgi:methanogenic corrinoid protein MtbC1